MEGNSTCWSPSRRRTATVYPQCFYIEYLFAYRWLSGSPLYRRSDDAWEVERLRGGGWPRYYYWLQYLQLRFPISTWSSKSSQGGEVLSPWKNERSVLLTAGGCCLNASSYRYEVPNQRNPFFFKGIRSTRLKGDTFGWATSTWCPAIHATRAQVAKLYSQFRLRTIPWWTERGCPPFGNHWTTKWHARVAATSGCILSQGPYFENSWISPTKGTL